MKTYYFTSLITNKKIRVRTKLKPKTILEVIAVEGWIPLHPSDIDYIDYDVIMKREKPSGKVILQYQEVIGI